MSDTPYLDVVGVLMFIGFVGFMLAFLWDNVFAAKVAISIFSIGGFGLVFLGMRV